LSVTWTEIEVAGLASATSTEVELERRGYLDTIIYERATGGSEYDSGATLTVEAVLPTGFTAQPVLTAVSLNASASWRPRTPAHVAAGTAVTDSTEMIALCNFQLRFSVTNGGAGKTGKFLVIYRR